MESNPLVSIVIPVYKAEKYIEECLKSCISQSYQKLEIIVVNDGSPDSSSNITQRYIAQDNRIREHIQPNKGVAAARKCGIELSSGEYIMQVDSDDFMESEYVQKMVTKAISEDADMVFCDIYRYSDDGVKTKIEVYGKKPYFNTGIEYLEANVSTFIWGKIYRRSVMQNLTAQSVNVSDDHFFNLQILPRCSKVAYLNEHLYYYRYNFSSIMNNNIKYLANQYLTHAIERRQFINNSKFTPKIKDNLAYDNIRIIHKYVRFVGVDDRVVEFIRTSFFDYKFLRHLEFKRLRMEIFLIIVRLSPTTARQLIKKRGSNE